MRFRPANIRLINRRSHLPRLLLALSSNNNKNHPTDSQLWTGSLHISYGQGHSISGKVCRPSTNLVWFFGQKAVSQYQFQGLSRMRSDNRAAQLRKSPSASQHFRRDMALSASESIRPAIEKTTSSSIVCFGAASLK